MKYPEPKYYVDEINFSRMMQDKSEKPLVTERIWTFDGKDVGALEIACMGAAVLSQTSQYSAFYVTSNWEYFIYRAYVAGRQIIDNGTG